ncbi:helicase-related protein [Clostridium folliculivorans]|uniref:RNA helicase n=1 Tax=Clostridium folliculivorans TaxID=2886038 RepID=A0A9W5Y4T0_9CLOT|nr:helicase-related protein [Clostridium folliculivorans]GKU26724.1 helicase [Clostridium folliculivorans]GKU28844.1 helicase [Clostridium folliculivorans]
MKRADERNFRKIKNQIQQIDEIVRHTKTNALWEHEASVRKKIKELSQFRREELRDYDKVYEGYVDVLNYISERLLDDYNKKNNSSFDFYSIVRNNFESYVSSGIISVLIAEHIPKIISEEFDEVFPRNPKDEYRRARAMKRRIFLHLGDTNTGKTYNSMQRLKQCEKGIYLSPLRILALENYERLNNEGIKCNLMTGEEEIIHEDAKHISCTIEKLDINEQYEIAIIDEIQMIDDDQRGAAWTRALLGLRCKEIHVCGAKNSKELLLEILEDCEDEYEIIEYKRQIPLIVDEKAFTLKDINPGDALVVFSKKRVLELGMHYSSLGMRASLIYGDLPPEVRRKQYESFISGSSKILISTDAIGMGVNLPIKRIVFMDIKKFDGNEIRFLKSQEVKQIGGRAGRKGIYDEGFVACSGNNQNFIEENLLVEDQVIEEAVLGPSEEILKIKSLSLREKLALWSTKKEKIHYYRKMDVSEYLVILDAVKSYKIPEEKQWKLMRIPIDISNEDIMKAFINYVDEHFVAKIDTLTKPGLKFYDLKELENYYQKINLYYSFSRSFKLEFDEEWVYEERKNVSEEINKILLNL